MRITGGILGGRQIKVSPKFNARPTTDIAREALFNILVNRFNFEELTVLDLFSGTGSIAFEFCSRGTTNVTCVEINNTNTFFIRKNAENLNISIIKIFQSDVLSFLLKSKQEIYDIIFADPPFDFPTRFKIAEYVFENRLLKPDGTLIIEHEPKDNYQNTTYFKELRKYGKVNFSFFEYNDDLR